MLDELGIEINQNTTNSVFVDPTGNHALSITDDISSRYGRLWYFQLAGRDPFNATNGLRPFTIADELELRIADGNNYQFVGSRFERSVNDIIGYISGGDVQNQFLRSDYQHNHEASEYRDQLDNAQLVFDNRRKLTMFSGVRNDLLPPWLRWEDRFWNRHDPENMNIPLGYDAFDIAAYEAAGVPAAARTGVFGSTFPTKVAIEGVNAAIIASQNGGDAQLALENAVLNWRQQARSKVDLREYYPTSNDFYFDIWFESNSDGRLSLAERAPLQILLALTDSQESGIENLEYLDPSGANYDALKRDANAPLGTYSTPDPDALWDTLATNYYQQARISAAGLASNLLTYRDQDSTWREHSSLAHTYDGTTAMYNLPLSQAVTPPVIGRQVNDEQDPTWGSYVPFAETSIAGPNEDAVEMLGMELQPFILETFIAHAHQAKAGGDPWACCLATGTCVEVSKETCEGLLGGTYFDGQVCDPDGDPGTDDGPCTDLGACCFAEGGCIYTYESVCIDRGGEFLGLAVSCSDTACIGACCVDGVHQPDLVLPLIGECLDLSSASCGEIGGYFAGVDTACATQACVPLGSCCFASASCMDVYNEDHCLSLFGTYNPGVFCFDDVCVAGACCLSSDYASCVDASETTCINLLNGTYLGVGTSCEITPCTTIGSCCFGSGTCVDVMSPSACLSDGGNYLAGTSCFESQITVIEMPIADTWIDEANPVTAHGADVTLLAGENATSARQHILLEFQLDPSIDSSQISSAILVLDFEELAGVSSVISLARLNVQNLGLGEGWVSETADWNTYDGTNVWPGGSGAGGDVDPVTQEYNFLVGSLGNVKLFIVDLVADAIENHAGKLSLIVYKDLPDGVQSQSSYASRETITEFQPRLTIQIAVGPNPCLSSCCLNTKICEEVSFDTCENLGGIFNQGVSCAENGCIGSCCFATGGCENLSQESCESNFDATFMGYGTSCDVEACGVEGACCVEYIADEIWLNEFQYDTVEPTKETVEIVLDNSVAIATVQVSLYDGDTGAVYGTLNGSDFLAGETQSGMTVYSTIAALQDGPDGLAISVNGVLVPNQFLSYEGIFIATDGPALGETSDLVPETQVAAPADSSIGLFGTGSYFSDFDWSVMLLSSGSVNAGQLLEEVIESEVCINVSETACGLLGGTYQGEASQCGSVPCGSSVIRGSCCFDTGECDDIDSATCHELNGVYQGDLVSCIDDPCLTGGSCCLDSSSCLDLEEISCTEMGGTFNLGQTCSEQPCIGACCVKFIGTDAACTNKFNASECLAIGGEFLQGTTCGARPCVGACCIDSDGDGASDVCENVSGSSCVGIMGGVFQGIGTSCATDPCVVGLSGACCMSAGNACTEQVENVCLGLGGTFQGENSVCEAVGCFYLSSYGACCINDGDACAQLLNEDCELIGGIYAGNNTLCELVDCFPSQSAGACCVAGDICADVVSEINCDALGGVYQDGVFCETNPCNVLLGGSCCLGDGICADTSSEKTCLALGGVYQGRGTACESSTCVGACCLPSGTCVNDTQANCDVLFGTFMGLGSSCETNPCRGACCLNSGSCLDVMVLPSCEFHGGTFMGFSTVCSTRPCEGACCLDPLGCESASPISCIEMGGTYLGSGTLCLSAPCVEGACCLENGECLETFQTSCDFLGGSLLIGATCSIDPCEGACCLWNGGCEILSKHTCEKLWDPDGQFNWEEDDPPGFFNGYGTTCTPLFDDDYTYANCLPEGKCCLPSGSCVNIMDVENAETAPDGFVYYCEEVLDGTYYVGENCGDTPCEGACCYGSGGCENLPQATCLAMAGDWQGGGVLCADSPCLEGACCFDSGSCLENTESVCENSLGGVWQGAGVLCADSTCVGYFLVTTDLAECPQETVAVVQLANPFDRAIDLNDFAVEFFGQDLKLEGLNVVLPPATPDNPSTLILYALPEVSTIIDPDGAHDFNSEWRDFLDIEVTDHPTDDIATPTIDESTIFVGVPNATWSTDRTYYDALNVDEQNSVALYKFDGIDGVDRQRVLIDRVDAPNSLTNFNQRVVEDLADEWLKLGTDGYVTLTDRDGNKIEALPNTSAMLAQWDRVTRAWGVDAPDVSGWHNDRIDPWERNPRYVFAAHDLIRSVELRPVANPQSQPPVSEIEFTSGFHWTEFTDPDDMDGDGNPDTADDDLLPDYLDPWFVVESWTPRAGTLRQGAVNPGEVVGGLYTHKPTSFDMNHLQDPQFAIDGKWSYPDKGWYGQRTDDDGDGTTSDTPAFEDTDADDSIDETDMSLDFSMQMLQKDNDFEQVGELLYLWLFGHMLEGTHLELEEDSYLVLPVSPLDDVAGTAVDAGTVTTFSEFMYPRWDATIEEWWAPWVGTIENDEVVLNENVNRLRFLSEGDANLPLMMAGRNEFDGFQAQALNHAWPRLSIAARVLDSFVCDGPGRPDITGDGIGDALYPTGSLQQRPSTHAFYNANGYSGKATPGIININTATVETLRMLPHMYKVVHATPASETGVLDTADRNPRSLLPESMVQWRESSNGSPDLLIGSGHTGGPNYENRTVAIGMDANAYGSGPKDTRGFSSPAEIGMLQQSAIVNGVIEPWNLDNQHNAIRDRDAWRIDFAAMDPFGTINYGTADELVDAGSMLSTEVNFADYYGEDTRSGDRVTSDAEEVNLLQAGISNLISTTSDMFTVHMRIRTFKRNPVTGIWDATDLDYIVDDSRYVMLVDRSSVNVPSDKPKILYLEKLPN
ncbi:MAG: DNRLRE domain-containing protein [Phycisphaerae bacterium]|nr:DNRLRE domain-containing protein [Phycisphaerae bacterium]